jgi:glutathione synthase/RimK-type ligase-like ATP-grasp enzyme
MQILVLGEDKDLHAKHIYDVLLARGVEVHYFNSRTFPTQSGISWYPDTQTGSLYLANGTKLQISEIHSVYWRSFNGIYVPELPDEHQQSIAFNDAVGLMRTLLQAPSIRWVNGWQAYEFHKEKPRQLAVVSNLGVTIPKTLISNDPDLITEFARTIDQAIFKPVYGGAHAKLITPEFLAPARLKLALKLAPIALQEFIAGTNIRTYVIGDRVFSAEIRTGAIDFRDDADVELIPLQIPPAIARISIAIARSLMLEWTAIDWRRNNQEEYYFLEANPSPMFTYFEAKTGYPLTEELVNLLVATHDLSG